MAQGMFFRTLRSEVAPNGLFPAKPNTPSAGDPSVDQARSAIDHDIAILEESIRALKSRRNELAPVSRLPPEILCNIFSLIEDRNAFEFMDPIRGWGSPESWIDFSRVSRHWRSIALSAPELWTNIPFNYPRWTQEMLTRSKMAKLTIRVDAYQSMNPRVFDSIESCLRMIERLGEINISTPLESMPESLFQDLPKSAPQLHTFRIALLPPSFPGPESPFTIHEDFLSDTERLKNVHLVNCKISWDSRLLTGLTYLTIHLHNSLMDNTTSSDSIISFLHALQRMPALTDLDLENSIPYDSGGLSNYPAVDLPCLRLLRISSGVNALTTALRHINFPNNAVLNLTCKATQFTQINFSKFLFVLAEKFLSFLVIRNLSVQVAGVAQNGLKFLAWTSATPQDCSFDSLVPDQFELVLSWPYLNDNIHNHTKTLIAAFDAMNLSGLTHLQLSTSAHIDSQTWLKTFGKLPLLEWVHVESYTVQSFLDALADTTNAADKSTSAYHNVPFPKLRHIRMSGTDFAYTKLGSISVDMLMHCLMERHERNAEIQELYLDHCYNISQDDIERLETIVVHVYWDGVEQGRYASEDSEDSD